MKASTTGLSVLTALLNLATTGLAHDMWLIPIEKSIAGAPTVIRVNSGMEFPLSEHAPDTAKFKKRFAIDPNGQDVAISAGGASEKSGLLKLDATTSGTYVAAVQTEPKLITLEADEFNHYLVVDGLPHIYLIRREEGLLDKPGRERYSKSPKTIFQIGEGGGGDPCKSLGLPLEIVPLRDPFGLKVSDTLRVRVEFGGKPLAGANLGWDAPGDGEPPSGTVRTDGKGEALIPIAQTGLMTIRLTHMTRPMQPDYEWESFWTTLTFRVPE